MAKMPHFDIFSWQSGMRWWRSYVAAARRVFAGLAVVGFVIAWPFGTAAQSSFNRCGISAGWICCCCPATPV